MSNDGEVERPALLRRNAWVGCAIAVLVVVVVGAFAESGNDRLSIFEAILLGIVEGVTEYLPVSSTAHLAVVEELLGLTTTETGRAAADAYAIVIQLGAIVAVVGLYRSRIGEMFRGVRGEDAAGRAVVVNLAVAFIPAAVVGLVFGDLIKDRLFAIWPIVVAWIVGGVALLSKRLTTARQHLTLDALTVRGAFVIGAAQTLALWPGTSRSLVTILAALFVGLGLPAAVEFSFLLGLATLSAATGYQLLRDGALIVDTFGYTNAAVGVAVAAVTAWGSVRWMVTYLQQHPLAVFGWYRISIGVAVATISLATAAL